MAILKDTTIRGNLTIESSNTRSVVSNTGNGISFTGDITITKKGSGSIVTQGDSGGDSLEYMQPNISFPIVDIGEKLSVGDSLVITSESIRRDAVDFEIRYMNDSTYVSVFNSSGKITPSTPTAGDPYYRHTYQVYITETLKDANYISIVGNDYSPTATNDGVGHISAVLIHNSNALSIAGSGAMTRIGSSSDAFSHKLQLGVGGTEYVYMTEPYGPMSKTSDMRDKIDFKKIETSVDFIKSLNPVTFLGNPRERYILEDGKFDEESYYRGDKAGDRRNSGFLAQEVYQSMIDCYGDDNYAKIVDYNNYNGSNSAIDRYYLADSALIPFMVRCLQEQQEEIEKLKNILNK